MGEYVKALERFIKCLHKTPHIHMEHYTPRPFKVGFTAVHKCIAGKTFLQGYYKRSYMKTLGAFIKAFPYASKDSRWGLQKKAWAVK